MLSVLRHNALRWVSSLAVVAWSAPARTDDNVPPPAPEPVPAQPAKSDAPVPEGETIVITGLRLPRPIRDVPAATAVLDRHEIARSPHMLVDDIVRTLPSVGTFRRSSSAIADPTSQGLSLRGVGSSGVSRALVLRDGVPVNDPFGGWVYWRAMSPLDIDRIEIVPSGESALFGDFALGGVMQVFSRPIERDSVDALVSGGSLATGRGAARATTRRGPIGVEIDGELLRSGGYTPIVEAQRGSVDHAADSRHVSTGVRATAKQGRSTLHATARFFDETLDAGTELTTADVRTFSYGAGWRLGDDLAVELFGGTQRFRQSRARVTPDRSSATLASEQETPSHNYGAAVAWTRRPLKGHTLVLGADGRLVAGTATDALIPAMPQPDSLVERSAGGTQRLAGLFVQDVMELSRRIDVTAALRFDAWQNVSGSRTLRTMSGEETMTSLPETSARQLSPRVGVLVRASEAVALRGSVYRAFRAPTLNELYRPFQVGTILTAANERLGPETLWGAEAGPQIVVDQVVMRATGFWNQLDDAIANVTLPMPVDGAQRQRQNLGTARIAGLDLDASWRPTRRWTATIGHMFSHAVVTDAPAQPALVDKRLAQVPRLRTVAAIAFDEPAWFSATAQVRYLGIQFEDDLNTRLIGSVILVDARVGRRIGAGLAAFASVQNLFDREYLVGRAGVDTGGAPRTFELGLQLER
jgi:iron complex outermembrane recepter protein